MAHHFIFLMAQFQCLNGDWEGWRFEHSVSYLWACLSTESAKNVSWPYLFSKDGVNLHTYHSTFYLATAQSQCLMATGRDSTLRTLYHGCRFASQQRVLKTLTGLGYLCSEDRVDWLWHFLVNVCIYMYTYILNTSI